MSKLVGSSGPLAFLPRLIQFREIYENSAVQTNPKVSSFPDRTTENFSVISATM